MGANGRMGLSNVTTGVVEVPHRVGLYGPEGIGKTTWAAGAPKPIFLPTEAGTERIDVARFPAPEKWGDVFDAVASLRTESHDYRTFVVDTVDWLERLIWDHICKRDGKSHIEDYGYGKGYTVALSEWRRLLAELEALQRDTQMHVVLVAHAIVAPFKNPLGEDYDRYSLKLYDGKRASASGLVKEWLEDVLFCNFEDHTYRDDKQRFKGIGDGARFVYTSHHAGYDAKNRHGLPEKLPLDFSDYLAACAGAEADAKLIRKEIADLVKELGDKALGKKVRDYVNGGKDVGRLVKARDRLRAKLLMKEGA